jgi:hypothetical protein
MGGKLRTVVIQIGNSDDKLTQGQWALYVIEVGGVLKEHEIHFSGGAESSAPWQNYCWVVNIKDDAMDGMFERLQGLRMRYNQDSIAVTIGDTQFMEGEWHGEETESI